MSDNKKKKTSYEDYKYVYTGYKDYCKKHNIKVTDTTEKKTEKVDHDHRFEFDFNNPNQHTHDYSFDFPTPPVEKQYDTSYNNQIKTTTSKSSTTTYNKLAANTSKTKKQSNGCGCLIFIFIFFTFFLPIISAIIDYSDNDYEYDDDYEYIYEESNYYDAIEAYADALQYINYNYVLNYLTPEEKSFNNGQYWQNDITNTLSLLNTNNIHDFDYDYYYEYQMSSYSRNTLQNNFNEKYSSNIIMTDAYEVALKIEINETTIFKYITVAEIDNNWYLISAS